MIKTCLYVPEPHFLHAIDYGNYVYFFLREMAVEYTTLGKVPDPRPTDRLCGGSIQTPPSLSRWCFLESLESARTITEVLPEFWTDTGPRF